MAQYLGFIFDPHDWLTDEKLGLCSFTTKGVWIELICWMYKSKRRGYLVVNDKSLDKEDIHKLLKCSAQEFDIAWKELIVHGVISQHADGTYYSKRVVNDAEKSNPQHGLGTEEFSVIDKVLLEFERIVGHAQYNVKDARDLIAMKMKREGAKFEDFVTVIKGKHKEWHDSEKMRVNLRPRTLFGDRFSDYLRELTPKQVSAAEGKKVVPRFDYGDL